MLILLESSGRSPREEDVAGVVGGGGVNCKRADGTRGAKRGFTAVDWTAGRDRRAGGRAKLKAGMWAMLEQRCVERNEEVANKI